jgi:hypothetical protein
VPIWLLLASSHDNRARHSRIVDFRIHMVDNLRARQAMRRCWFRAATGDDVQFSIFVEGLMMRKFMAVLGLSLFLASPAYAVSPYFEDFETGTDGWNKWSSALDALSLDTSHNHTPGYQSTPGNPPALPVGHAYRESEAEPNGFASFTTIADGTGKLRVDVWAYVDNASPDVDDSRGMLQLTQGASTGTDYLQLGWLQDYLGGSERYSVRTRRRDQLSLGTFDTGISRPAVNDWVKLSIEADAGVGGNVRFYINDALAYTGVGERLGANLDTIRLGVNFGNNHDTVWYDDVTVTPEPASAVLFGLGGLGLVGFSNRRRRATA